MKKQFHGIKYPFTYENNDGLYMDLNEDAYSDVKSQLYHVIFTPKGVRYMMPDFGTDLIRYIYAPNDTITWDSVRVTIDNAVSLFVPMVTINDIKIVKNEDTDNSIFIQITYVVKVGNNVVEDVIGVTLDV